MSAVVCSSHSIHRFSYIMRISRFSSDHDRRSKQTYCSYDTDETLEDRWNELSVRGKRTVGVTANCCPLDRPPDWFDRQRFLRAQSLAQRNLFSLNISHLIGNVLLVLLPEVLVPIVATGTSSTAYQVLLRVLSTVVHINSWYEGDPFEVDSRIHRSLMQVRRGCHLQVTRLLNAKYPNEKAAHPLLDGNNLWLSQYDMAMTQWSLIGTIAALPDQCAFYMEPALRSVTANLMLIQDDLAISNRVAELVVLPAASSAQHELVVHVKHIDSPEVIETKSFDHDLSSIEVRRLYELQEFMYLWRVLGHCMGIHDEFNVTGQQCVIRNVLFLRICLDRGYRSVLCKPSPLVDIGQQLVQGLFTAFSFLLPAWIITYEGFMKYWYDAMRIPHNFQLRTRSQRLSYWLPKFTIETMLRVSWIYRLVSFLFFWLLGRLLKQVRANEQLIRTQCGHERYEVLDSTGVPFRIENKLYKSNV